MARKIVIETPRGRVYIDRTGTRAVLAWSTDFVGKWHSRYADAQCFVDSEVLRLCEPFTPLLTGMLIDSGTLGTEIGSGLVQWIAPYSRYQYYLHRKTPSQTGPLRGSQWFQRMKEVHGRKILEGARRMFGDSKR